MSKHALTLIPVVTCLLLIGCATSDDRGAPTGPAILKAAAAHEAVVAEELAVEDCKNNISLGARDACLSRQRFPQAASNAPIKPAPKAKFDDLEKYKTKRDAELAKSE